MSDPSRLPPSILASVRENRSRFRTIGIVLLILGILAILFPIVFSVAAKVMLGWVFLLTGAVMLWHAFQVRDWRPALWSGAVAVLHLGLGVYLAFFALTGLIGLTFLLGLMFLLQGGFEVAMALQHRPEKGWGWLAANGVITGVLGVLLIAGLPGTALWAIGLLLGINFLMSGLTFLALVRAADAEG